MHTSVREAILETEYRPARTGEMDVIYLMGIDAWAEGGDVGAYLEGCRQSIKYKSGQWVVLTAEGRPVSSLLIHRFEPWGGYVVRGIGSVATEPSSRRRGYGQELVRRAIEDLSLRHRAAVFLLYSDIGEAFYERLRFFGLPDNYQRRAGSTLMAKLDPGVARGIFEANRSRIPGYF